jgi:hypothetical protein
MIDTKGLLAILSKLMEEKNNSPDISEVSLHVEHQKYKLANYFGNKKKKKLFLGLRNVTLIQKSNLYAAVGQILFKNQDLDETLKQFKESQDHLLVQLKGFIEHCKK